MDLRKVSLLSALVVGFALTSPAHAAVEHLKLKFKGGCTLSNTTGSCTLGASASGTNVAGAGVVFSYAPNASGPFTYLSATSRKLNSSGEVSVRLQNRAGCYRVTTTPNGNHRRDVRSGVLCEK